MNEFYFNDETIKYFKDLTRIYNEKKIRFKVWKFVENNCYYEDDNDLSSIRKSLLTQIYN